MPDDGVGEETVETTMEHGELPELESRLRTLLPGTYQVFDEQVRPVSMGSARLKYGPDGRVPWNEMWASFCDLAMAGGPPHRGTFLQPSMEEGAIGETAAYADVAEEICRGLRLVTGLYAEPSHAAGWINLYCTSAAMTGWLMRAIVMENVCAVGRGLVLSLPTGSTFRVEKEVKNVITAVAKTCHYWQDHMPDAQHEEVRSLLATLERENPLVYPPVDGEQREEVAGGMARVLEQDGGLTVVLSGGPGWLGVDCGTVADGVWLMRALAVGNVLSRCEGSVVFFPVAETPDRGGQTVAAVLRAHRLAGLARAAERF